MTIDVEHFLATELGLGDRSAAQLIRSAPERYKVYHIKKRNSDDTREIAHPASELKIVQRALVDKWLCNLPIHPAAMAYVKGTSIRLNAATHAENGPIKKFDFENFFPSLTEQTWISYCLRTHFCDRNQAVLLGRLLFRRPRGGQILRLSIGAPSSPIVSNILMYEFDRLISERVSAEFVTYTRYADDLTFSAKRTGYLNSVEPILRRTLNQLSSPKLKLNESKTVTATRKYRRQVTGLILTNDKRVSLGREKKRLLRAAIHRFSKDELTIDETVTLAGQMAFAADVEPEFYTRMQLKYGSETLSALKLSVKGYHRPQFRDDE